MYQANQTRRRARSQTTLQQITQPRTRANSQGTTITNVTDFQPQHHHHNNHNNQIQKNDNDNNKIIIIKTTKEQKKFKEYLSLIYKKE